MSITLEQFITKHRLKFECRKVKKWNRGQMDYLLAIRIRKPISVAKIKNSVFAHRGSHIPRSFSVYFSQGPACKDDPTLADVLDCLAGDACGYENAVNYAKAPQGFMARPDAFTKWASDYGYDTDSRRAEKIFRAVKRQAERLKRTLGPEAYEELLWNTERL